MTLGKEDDWERQRRESLERNQNIYDGRMCAKCNRMLNQTEPAFKCRTWLTGHTHQLHLVCENCRPDYGEWSTLTPCAGCGRPMSYRLGAPGKPPITCCSRCSAVATKRRNVKPHDRQCIVCKTSFIPKRGDALTCSHRCRQKAYRDRARDSKLEVITSRLTIRHTRQGNEA